MSVFIAVVVFGFLRMGGMNQQDLAEMREESQRQLAEARQMIGQLKGEIK